MIFYAERIGASRQEKAERTENENDQTIIYDGFKLRIGSIVRHKLSGKAGHCD